MKPDEAKLTCVIPKALWKAAKQRALDTDRDLRNVVIEALEAHLGTKLKKAGAK
jgi:hypothetical protein